MSGGARFTPDAYEIRVDANKGGYFLHGGNDGIHHHIRDIDDPNAENVVVPLDLVEEPTGFPGRLSIRAEIPVADDALSFDPEARSDAAPPARRDHRFSVAADHWLAVNAAPIPIGEITPVDGTEFDTRAASLQICDGRHLTGIFGLAGGVTPAMPGIP
ncbi:hypothetical protein [Rhodobacter sp. 24-YEA-8]|uniref:aldose epimerase family protein n=1 Tax=Rhodobacter sp. 24-YEA-8 TaxID=1884310 RepID=UPI001495E9BE|nr:hypothetical protein [Rhodobacter sp. 24-YEA-8]